ncbi:hypothetical protein HAX54_030078 [Datura stramonium]|uniref:Uncharacterized protein n=1 Tax=Datura stramonium TaxID=4076 RepID=A0ABS8V719_DATST|nr:hypothetical protein [Datura stramonium]
MSRTIYANGDQFGGSIERDAVEVELFGQSSDISRWRDKRHVFGSSKATKLFIEELERESGGGFYYGSET